MLAMREISSANNLDASGEYTPFAFKMVRIGDDLVLGLNDGQRFIENYASHALIDDGICLWQNVADVREFYMLCSGYFILEAGGRIQIELSVLPRENRAQAMVAIRHFFEEMGFGAVIWEVPED